MNKTSRKTSSDKLTDCVDGFCLLKMIMRAKLNTTIKEQAQAANIDFVLPRY